MNKMCSLQSVHLMQCGLVYNHEMGILKTSKQANILN